jgi:hypothetical protein
MKLFKTAALIGLISAAVVVLALEPAAGASPESNVAVCSKAIIGSGPASWRRESIVAGPVGVSGEAMRTMSRTANGDLINKMPLLVEGQATVTVSVPPALRKRVFLYYGNIIGRDGKPTHSYAEARGYGETEFQPCADKPRTVWSGGVRVKGTAPVHLLVRTGEGAAIPLRLGRPRVYQPKS